MNIGIRGIIPLREAETAVKQARLVILNSIPPMSDMAVYVFSVYSVVFPKTTS